MCCVCVPVCVRKSENVCGVSCAAVRSIRVCLGLSALVCVDVYVRVFVYLVSVSMSAPVSTRFCVCVCVCVCFCVSVSMFVYMSASVYVASLCPRPLDCVFLWS